MPCFIFVNSLHTEEYVHGDLTIISIASDLCEQIEGAKQGGLGCTVGS